MEDTIVVINAGSSSLKFTLYSASSGALSPYLRGAVEGLYTNQAHFSAHDNDQRLLDERRWPGTAPDHAAGMQHIVAFVQAHLGRHRIGAIGHRIVHGGSDFTAPVRLDAAVLARLERLVPLAPLHQPHNLAPVRAVLALAPHLLQVGCFDTAFHTSQPALAQAYALPPAITARGVRRYGFHGLSYEYVASVLPALRPRPGARVVVAHLGNGASLCALDGGRSVATTMGFTALDGLPMGTRCGALDPGVVLYLLNEVKMDARAIEHLLYQQSGLLGVSGISSDMRTLEHSADPRARLAIDLFVYRIGRELGSLAAALGGLDGLVFTAGIGEHSAAVRQAVARAAGWLGLTLDAAANAGSGTGLRCISTADSKVAVWVVPTDEELMIARDTQRFFQAGAEVTA